MFWFKCSFTIILLIVGGAVTERRADRRRAIPVIFVTGSHYEVGFDAGRAFSGVIRNFLATYENLRQFEKEYKTNAGKDAYEKTLANMNERYPYYVKEIQGIADGAGVPFHQLFLLHMDDIIGTINDNTINRDDTGGCTSIGINNADATILGHTEDAFSETENHFYILSAHVIPTAEDRERGAVEERFASLCYAGQMPGYTSGFNENGLVFSINTLSPLTLKPGNTPRTFITRSMLRSKNFSEAKKILTDEGLGIANGFSVNMIWSEPWGERQMYNVEVAPDLHANKSVLNIQKYEKDALVHCNIYHRINVTQVIGPIIDSSETRLKTIHSHTAPKTRVDVVNIISDTSGKEFRIFEDRREAVIKTIAAGIFDLNKRTWSLFIDKANASEPIAVLPIRYHRINVTQVIGPIIDSSETRLKTIHSHTAPKTRVDVVNIISDTSGKEFRIFEDRREAVIKTIAAGIFDLNKRTWSLFIDKANASEPIAVLPIRFPKLD